MGTVLGGRVRVARAGGRYAASHVDPLAQPLAQPGDERGRGAGKHHLHRFVGVVTRFGKLNFGGVERCDAHPAVVAELRTPSSGRPSCLAENWGADPSPPFPGPRGCCRRAKPFALNVR